MLAYSQKSVRIGYIDTDYILENIPQYQEINQQLNSNVGDWKKEIDKRESAVKNKREVFNKERILLTVELIQEREEDLEIEEEEIYQYKQDRFGPNGDFILQKKQLIQPIQDQIFLAIQEIAKTKKYDFIFDKSADIVMLYSDKRFDISEQILRTILRSNNQDQVESRREKKKLEQESIISKSDLEDPRKLEIEKKKKEAEVRRNEITAIKEAKRSESEEKRKKLIAEKEIKKTKSEEKIKKLIAEREANKIKVNKERKKIVEERELKKIQIEERRSELLKKKKEINNDSDDNARERLLLDRKKEEEKFSKSNNPKQTINEKKINPTVEDRRRLLEEKKKRILEGRKAKLDYKKISKDSTFTKN